VDALNSIRQQDYGPIEVIVVDGMSSDSTRSLVEDYARGHPECSVRLLDNPGRIQASGWNIGIRAASGDYVLRIDAVHCRLGPNYVRCCLEKMLELQQSDPCVAAVGGRRLTVPSTAKFWTEAIALGQSCRFGVGNATYRLGRESGFTDTLGVPLYDRRILSHVGLFDESLGRSEDNELHARLRQRKFKLYFAPECIALYHPRTTLAALAAQMFHNGWWVSATLVRKLSFPFGIRHVIPFAFYLLLVLTAIFTTLGSLLARISLYLLLATYISLSIGSAIRICSCRRFWRVAVVFWVMHASYATGTLSGFFTAKSKPAIGEDTAPGADLGL